MFIGYSVSIKHKSSIILKQIYKKMIPITISFVKIGLSLRSISLKTDILQKIDEFEKYYRSAHQTIKNFIKENQDLIDCLGIIACRIVLDSSDQIEHLKQFFIEITGLPMTIQNGKKILEESDGEIAYNFKESGGIDDIK